MMKIAIGADHAGFALKALVIAHLHRRQIVAHDCGTYSEASCDFPDYAHAVALSIEQNLSERGILICGSGQGVAMTANKHSAVRAALCWTTEIAALSRAHNDANVLCLPARFITAADACDMIDAFLDTPFEGGRHQRRVDKIALT